ncbi:MBL fold metallo-hydrolase [Parasphingopyxis lamellibrachiae]|uniref:Ribonuclease Z n=1 Tax=Parasphingopyxis lamellibrachiae TaxID=680125 RepID=A0A3D9FKG8_9SPHN|nr:MBL fold metallo-hydrolase [Parasphingopyxis lamellibrachiae]RED17596.1 ribonuclease Z [Parasphingopyxis lamellibrachiae]
MRRTMIVLGALVGVALALGWYFRAEIGERLFVYGVDAAIDANGVATLPDGLHVVMCGTGSPLPDPSRAGPCTAVIAGERVFIVDVGAGAVRNFGRMGLPVGDVDAVFLTHYHSDHIDGLGELMLLRWTGGGNRAPLPIYGPPGVEDLVGGLARAYAMDTVHRVAHHGEEVVPSGGQGGEARTFAVPAAGAMHTLYSGDGLRVQAFRVDHGPVRPAVGYRFDYGGRSIVISGDTTRNDMVARACGGCDLLVHEALNIDMVQAARRRVEASGNARLAQILEDITDYHTTPVEAEEVAIQARARMLVLTHIVPAAPNGLVEAYFLRGTGEAYDGQIVLAQDGMRFTLPAGSAAIERD